MVFLSASKVMVGDKTRHFHRNKGTLSFHLGGPIKGGDYFIYKYVIEMCSTEMWKIFSIAYMDGRTVEINFDLAGLCDGVP